MAAKENGVIVPSWVRFLSNDDRRIYERLKFWIDCSFEDMIQLEELLDDMTWPEEDKARIRAKIQDITRYEVSAAEYFIRRIYKEAENAYKRLT